MALPVAHSDREVFAYISWNALNWIPSAYQAIVFVHPDDNFSLSFLEECRFRKYCLAPFYVIVWCEQMLNEPAKASIESPKLLILFFSCNNLFLLQNLLWGYFDRVWRHRRLSIPVQNSLLILFEFMGSDLLNTNSTLARKLAIGVVDFKHFLFFVMLPGIEAQPIVSDLILPFRFVLVRLI